MRLIDADTLTKNLEWYCYPAICGSYNGVRCRACLLGDALIAIEEASTADPIEWLKSWIGEIMLNTDNEPIEPSEIIRRIDEGGLKRFIDDHERGVKTNEKRSNRYWLSGHR